jgi:hypothetical protein
LSTLAVTNIFPYYGYKKKCKDLMCSLSVSHKSLDNYYIDLYRDCTHQLLGLLNDFIRYITKQKNYIAQTNKDFYLRVYKKIAVFKSKMDIKKYNKKYLEYSPFC